MLGLCSSTQADTWDKKTAVTFGEPVEVPGTALPAGTYVFILAPSRADRHLVQIFNEDETQLIATERSRHIARRRPSNLYLPSTGTTPIHRSYSTHGFTQVTTSQ